MDNLKVCLVKEFEVKELGKLKYFFGPWGDTLSSWYFHLSTEIYMCYIYYLKLVNWDANQ